MNTETVKPTKKAYSTKNEFIPASGEDYDYHSQPAIQMAASTARFSPLVPCRGACCGMPVVHACLGSSTVYVAPSGNDQNNGTMPATAVKSVARGLALAAARTEVKIAGGL